MSGTEVLFVFFGLRFIHTIRFQASDSWFRKLDAGVQTIRFQGSVFVGAFHFSRRMSDENKACSISIRFFKIADLCVGRSFLLYSHDPIFGTNKNRVA